MAVDANFPKFNANLVTPASTITIPGPDIKFPIPAIKPLPMVSPAPSILPPSPKASIVVFTLFKTFLIAGSNIPPPIEAPALVKLAIVLLASASKVWFSCSFLL